MFDRWLLIIFFVCLIGCASMVLLQIWSQGAFQAPLYFQTAATVFIVGLGCFLTWFVRMQ